LPNQRILAHILRKNALALKEVGRYQESISYMEQVKPMTEQFLAADPNDARAENDLLVVFENEAECFEDRANQVFTEGKVNPDVDAANALKHLSKALSLTEHLLQINPDNVYWRSTQGLLLIRMSLQQRALHETRAALESAAEGVAILKAVGRQQNAQGDELDAVATGLTIVMPERFRDPHLAVECAERMVNMSHHRKPGFLFTLARAYRIDGQLDKARATANEGLSLFPAATTLPSRIRKQLQKELGE